MASINLDSSHQTKRLKTTHVLPVTHNGSTVSVTVGDNRLDAATEVTVSVTRADGQAVPDGTLELAAKPAELAAPQLELAGGGDGTLRCMKLSPELTAGLLETKHPHPFDDRIKFRESDHKPV